MSFHKYVVCEMLCQVSFATILGIKRHAEIASRPINGRDSFDSFSSTSSSPPNVTPKGLRKLLRDVRSLAPRAPGAETPPFLSHAGKLQAGATCFKFKLTWNDGP